MIANKSLHSIKPTGDGISWRGTDTKKGDKQLKFQEHCHLNLHPLVLDRPRTGNLCRGHAHVSANYYSTESTII